VDRAGTLSCLIVCTIAGLLPNRQQVGSRNARVEPRVAIKEQEQRRLNSLGMRLSRPSTEEGPEAQESLPASKGRRVRVWCACGNQESQACVLRTPHFVHLVSISRRLPPYMITLVSRYRDVLSFGACANDMSSATTYVLLTNTLVLFHTYSPVWPSKAILTMFRIP
jgi:hypothetical protein